MQAPETNKADAAKQRSNNKNKKHEAITQKIVDNFTRYMQLKNFPGGGGVYRGIFMGVINVSVVSNVLFIPTCTSPSLGVEDAAAASGLPFFNLLCLFLLWLC